MNGIWRTVGGRRIFIKEGQDLASAMRESGKFGTKKEPTDEELLNTYRGLKKGWNLEKEYKKEYNKFIKENEDKLKDVHDFYNKLDEIEAEEKRYKDNYSASTSTTDYDYETNRYKAIKQALNDAIKNNNKFRRM